MAILKRSYSTLLNVHFPIGYDKKIDVNSFLVHVFNYIGGLNTYFCAKYQAVSFYVRPLQYKFQLRKQVRTRSPEDGIPYEL